MASLLDAAYVQLGVPVQPRREAPNRLNLVAATPAPAARHGSVARGPAGAAPPWRPPGAAGPVGPSGAWPEHPLRPQHQAVAAWRRRGESRSPIPRADGVATRRGARRDGCDRATSECRTTPLHPCHRLAHLRPTRVTGRRFGDGGEPVTSRAAPSGDRFTMDGTADARRITLYRPEDFEGMRRAGRLAAETLDMIEPHVRPRRHHRPPRRAVPRLHRRARRDRRRR